MTREKKSSRFFRVSYLFFRIGFFLYHVMCLCALLYGLTKIAQLGVSPGIGYPAAVFLGVLPGLIIVIWLVLDSTTCCCNAINSRGKAKNCCSGATFMFVPMLVSGAIKSLLYIVGAAMTVDKLNDVEWMGAFLEELKPRLAAAVVFWIAFECGPILYLAIDWIYYYRLRDANGVLGTKRNPSRCILAQCTTLAVIFGAFGYIVFSFVEDINFLIPAFIQGAQILYALFLNFGGCLNGNKISGPAKMLCYVFGILQLIFTLSILCLAFGAMVFFLELNVPVIFMGPVVVVAALYMLALIVPSMMAWFSFKTDNSGYESTVNNISSSMR